MRVCVDKIYISSKKVWPSSQRMRTFKTRILNGVWGQKMVKKIRAKFRKKTPNAMSGGRFDSGRARRGAARARARRVKTATRHGVR